LATWEWVRPCVRSSNGQCPLEERQRLAIAPLEPIDVRQIVQAEGYTGILWPQRLLPDRERLLVKRQRLHRVALVAVHDAEIIHALRHVGMGGPQRLLPQFHCSLRQRQRLGISGAPEEVLSRAM
jgi:hypothetical protein